MRKHIVLLGVILAAGLSFSCSEKKTNSPAGDVRPVREVLAAGRSPVAIGPARRALVGVGGPTFHVRVRNVTDASLEAIVWTVVAFDEEGRLIPDGEEEGGYADALQPVGPGEETELSFLVSSEKAASVKLVLKEVVYALSEATGRSAAASKFQWTNPYYAADLKTARGISVWE